MAESSLIDTTEDPLAELRGEIRAAQLFLDRAAGFVHRLAPHFDQFKELRPGWRDADDELCLLIRRFERLRVGREQLTAPTRFLTLREAAERVPGGLKSNGNPQDSMYNLARRIGDKSTGSWLIAEDALDAYLRGEEQRRA